MREYFKRLKTWVEMCPVEAAMRIEELEAKVQRYEKALSFYADPEMYTKHNYYDKVVSAVELDGGSLAREKLERRGAN